jgi:ABC-type nitrate/sulfonate/bicarbonate transport system permease component
MKINVGRITRAYLLPVATLVAILVVWEAAYHIFNIPKFIIPAPSGIIAETWEWRSRLVGHTWVTRNPWGVCALRWSRNTPCRASGL